MHNEDPRWTPYLNAEEVHKTKKYKSLFRVIKNKLQWLRKHPKSVQNQEEVNEVIANKARKFDFINNMFVKEGTSLDELIQHVMEYKQGKFKVAEY